VDVGSVAGAALGTVQLAAEAKQVRIQQDLGGSSALVLGDPNRLQQVIWNLLSNAIKFTPAGGTVQLEVRDTRKTVRIAVKDSGIGIRKDFLPHVFEPFRQADSATTRVHGGLGLGLSIVRYLVELHGGHISAESEGEGKGATFIVELPHLRKNKSAPDADLPVADVAPAEVVDLAGRTVLVIDDQDDVREFIALALRRAGAQVFLADSVENALSVEENETGIDLVLCDLAMPREDGFSYVRRMQERPAGERIPVYAVTAFGGDPQDQKRVEDAGFAGFIRKPVEPDTLTRIVQDATN
jgi:CheY-like chemotaxis protein